MLVYNIPDKQAVLFLGNSNNVFGKTTEIIQNDYRRFLGGFYARPLPTNINNRPLISNFYNHEMCGVDNFNQLIHDFTCRTEVNNKNKLSWISKPLYIVFDMMLLNTYYLHREISLQPSFIGRVHIV